MADLPDRKTIKDALRATGLSNRQIRAFFARGWRGVVPEVEAEAAELREQLAEYRGSLTGHAVS